MKPGRNDPCPCGSGRKYKKCCEGTPAGAASATSPATSTVPTQEECGQLSVWFRDGRFAQLESLADVLSVRYPTSGFVWTMLGLARQMQAKDGLPALRRAAELLPDDASAHNNLGLAEHGAGRLEAAVAAFGRALRLAPDFAQAHNNLGNALKDLGRLDDAEAAFGRALACKPDHDIALLNLGQLLTELGRNDEAVALYRRALAIRPDNDAVHDNLLLTMLYSERHPAAEVFAAHRAYAERLERPLEAGRLPHENVPEPGRRLRVGYVSPDFRQHSVAHFAEVVLAQHDRRAVEVCCYFSGSRPDVVTRRLQGLADRWVDCAGLDDEALARRIRADGIDVLVDLAGHTANNRLLVFARKPAPVQVTWLGYPATTGLQAMDYRLTDGLCDPVGGTEGLHSEALWRLPVMFCYRGSGEDRGPIVERPPGETRGFVTFGSFNNYAKVSDAALQCWARVLDRVPTARLLLKIKGIETASFRQATEARLRRAGLPLERVDLVPWGRSPYSLYQDVDLALDPFPYNGTTISMECLTMGVPFVALAGDTCVSRMGVTILTNAGLPELIAATEQDYVELAVRLATDAGWLRALRSGLREKVVRSPLMDEVGFTRQLESAYRGMWERWCTKAAGS